MKQSGGHHSFQFFGMVGNRGPQSIRNTPGVPKSPPPLGTPRMGSSEPADVGLWEAIQIMRCENSRIKERSFSTILCSFKPCFKRLLCPGEPPELADTVCHRGPQHWKEWADTRGSLASLSPSLLGAPRRGTLGALTGLYLVPYIS